MTAGPCTPMPGAAQPSALTAEIRATIAAAEARFTQQQPPALLPHPSRRAPLCQDCAHAVQDSARKTYCAHPSAPVSLINGTPCVPAAAMRQDQRDCAAPRGVEVCGPTGRLFQAVALFAAPEPQ